MSTVDTLEQLDRPPVIEVVCGIFFERIDQIDPLMLGTYWQRRRTEYPGRELRPAVVEIDEPLVFTATPPLRALLVSQDDAFVLQAQNDRFYLNWRRRTQEARYPRFRDPDTDTPGVLSKLLCEYEDFERFCLDSFGRAPVPRRIELAKIDLLVQGTHWSDFRDLSQWLPWLMNFGAFSKTDRPDVALRFHEVREHGALTVTVATNTEATLYGPSSRVVKLETRISAAAGNRNAHRDAFQAINQELNRVFGELVPDRSRFMGGAS